jgi:hypothetical protein
MIDRETPVLKSFGRALWWWATSLLTRRPEILQIGYLLVSPNRLRTQWLSNPCCIHVASAGGRAGHDALSLKRGDRISDDL